MDQDHRGPQMAHYDTKNNPIGRTVIYISVPKWPSKTKDFL